MIPETMTLAELTDAVRTLARIERATTHHTNDDDDALLRIRDGGPEPSVPKPSRPPLHDYEPTPPPATEPGTACGKLIQAIYNATEVQAANGWAQSMVEWLSIFDLAKAAREEVARNARAAEGLRRDLKAQADAYLACDAMLGSAIRERDEGRRLLGNAQADLERARTYKGLEGYPCPLCTYQNGVFVKRCEMHAQLDAAREECEQLRSHARLQSSRADDAVREHERLITACRIAESERDGRGAAVRELCGLLRAIKNSIMCGHNFTPSGQCTRDIDAALAKYDPKGGSDATST